ncbi:glucosidase 2 subunit beta-like [Babylonia areolata]|uniref:glucosidase 2 subunit beta-like n=1 Tax=Babylonia areolata TaxID=304850 RepID=UPI003FD3F5B9
MFSKLLLLIAVTCAVKASERPRGVSPTRAGSYQSGKDFTCLDSGETIPWQFVNDDYCDCKDGTDEPGTSACINGVFFCENRGHRGIYLTSSRVNDGICDCCDGSDEFEERIKCVNQCDEIGRQEREEREKFRLLQEQGYKVKQEYMQQGKRTKDEKRSRLSELEKQVTDLKSARDELQRKKDDAEGPEKEAKEKHEKAWEELKAERQALKDREKAVGVFAELDINNDNVVDFVEMLRHSEFDIDSDGSVSVEEAKEYLDDNEEVELETFQNKIYPNIKDIYKSLTENGQAPDQPLPDEMATPPPPPEEDASVPRTVPTPDGPADGSDIDDDDDEEDDYDKEDDEDEEEEERGEEAKTEQKKEEEQEDQMPPYDAETQKLIELADAVRSEYNEADTKVRDAENEINGLKKYLEVDYGPNEEYSSLRGQCFEYTDREYTYKLCPFDKAVQRPKSGGMETSLGTWGHWYGPEEDKYDAMKYENGQSCWNGPSRSCHVNLHCGTENKLTGASEPSRCEYQFEFTTPARCKHPQDVPTAHPHEEL